MSHDRSAMYPPQVARRHYGGRLGPSRRSAMCRVLAHDVHTEVEPDRNEVVQVHREVAHVACGGRPGPKRGRLCAGQLR